MSGEISQSTANELLKAAKRMIADLREVESTGLCGRRRDEQILDLKTVIILAEGGIGGRV